MNVKRFLLASLAVFVLLQITSFVIHNLLLMKTYEALSSVWRPDMMSKMWIMYPSSVVYTLFFVYIFINGYENRGLWEGVRYGLVIGLFMGVPSSLGQYMVYPLPFSLVSQWFIYGLVESIVAGVAAAAIYRSR
jgi:hypothetical protein